MAPFYAIMARIVATVVAGGAFFWVRSLYTFGTNETLVKDSLEVMERTRSPYDPVFSLNSFVLHYLPWVLVIVLAFIWVPFIWKKIQEVNIDTGSSTNSLALLFAVGAFMLAGTNYSEAYYSTRDDAEYFMCRTNETCFQIGFTKDTMKSQAVFKSEQFYLESKVSLARFPVLHMVLEKSGMMTANMYIPAVQFIVVNRAPIWRYWTSSKDTGSTDKNQGFDFESKDSINIKTAGTCTAFIKEENAHKYLYWYGVKEDPKFNRNDPEALYATATYAVPLADVMDTEMHGLFETIMIEEFGAENFNTVFTKKTEINKRLNQRMKEYYEPRGITIGYCSIAASLTFEDIIQKALNDKYIAENPATAQMMDYRSRNADIMVREGLAEGLKTRGLPTSLFLAGPDLMSIFAPQTMKSLGPTPTTPTSAPPK